MAGVTGGGHKATGVGSYRWRERSVYVGKETHVGGRAGNVVRAVSNASIPAPGYCSGWAHNQT